MTLLDPRAPLVSRPQRLLVAGASGSGKSTFCRAASEALDLPYTELDSLFHGPDWMRRPTFEADVAALAAQPRWVVEWQYRDVRSLLVDRADTMLWLDLPRRAQMRQIIVRTVRRRLRREELWNGNIEPPLHRFLTDRDHIVRWAWRTQPAVAGKVRDVTAHRPELPVVRVRSRGEAYAWLDRAAAG